MPTKGYWIEVLGFFTDLFWGSVGGGILFAVYITIAVVIYSLRN